MNSREAAYDEEEQLRRAIEASKELVDVPDEGTTRRTKRGRSDSEEYVEPGAKTHATSRRTSRRTSLTRVSLQEPQQC